MTKEIKTMYKEVKDFLENSYSKNKLEELIGKHGKDNVEKVIVEVYAEMLFELLDYEEKGEGFAEFCCQTAKQVFDGVYNNLQEIQDEVNDIFETVI